MLEREEISALTTLTALTALHSLHPPLPFPLEDLIRGEGSRWGRVGSRGLHEGARPLCRGSRAPSALHQPSLPELGLTLGHSGQEHTHNRQGESFTCPECSQWKQDAPLVDAMGPTWLTQRTRTCEGCPKANGKCSLFQGRGPEGGRAPTMHSSAVGSWPPLEFQLGASLPSIPDLLWAFPRGKRRFFMGSGGGRGGWGALKQHWRRAAPRPSPSRACHLASPSSHTQISHCKGIFPRVYILNVPRCTARGLKNATHWLHPCPRSQWPGSFLD